MRLPRDSGSDALAHLVEIVDPVAVDRDDPVAQLAARPRAPPILGGTMPTTGGGIELAVDQS